MRSQKPYRNRRVLCIDGFSMSVQASQGNYCIPRVNNSLWYNEVEIGFPSSKEPVILQYMDGTLNDPTDAVYGYVPVDLVRHIIDKHGGIKEGEVPKGVPVYGKTHSRDYDK